MAHFRHLLRRYNLTEPQWRVLKTMDDAKSIELSELARKAALLMPSLSRIVRELEQRGYMTKTVDQTDMRRMLATLTERGRMLVDKASPECEAVNVAIRAAMGNERMAKLQGLLAQLEKRIGPLDLTATIRHVGSRWGDNANTRRVHGFTTVDAAVGYRIRRDARLMVRGRNLTDEIYTQSISNTAGRLEPPRSVDVTLTLDLRH